MRKEIIERTLYQYDELSARAQQKALEWFEQGYPDHGWWESVYEDADRVGLRISAFELDYYCTGVFVGSASDTANAILEEHRPGCETYKDAQKFLADLPKDTEQDWEMVEELSEEFLKTILEDYRIILRSEYEYQTSKEVLEELIRSMGYEFTEDGKID